MGKLWSNIKWLLLNIYYTNELCILTNNAIHQTENHKHFYIITWVSTWGISTSHELTQQNITTSSLLCIYKHVYTCTYNTCMYVHTIHVCMYMYDMYMYDMYMYIQVHTIHVCMYMYDMYDMYMYVHVSMFLISSYGVPLAQ